MVSTPYLTTTHIPVYGQRWQTKHLTTDADYTQWVWPYRGYHANTIPVHVDITNSIKPPKTLNLRTKQTIVINCDTSMTLRIVENWHILKFWRFLCQVSVLFKLLFQIWWWWNTHTHTHTQEFQNSRKHQGRTLKKPHILLYITYNWHYLAVVQHFVAALIKLRAKVRK